MAKGNCYENCARFMIQSDNAKDWTLCHGTAFGRGGEADGLWFGHAWLEKVDVAMDLTRDKWGESHKFPTVVYHALGNVRDVTEYTCKEALLMLVQHEHYGPWGD